MSSIARKVPAPNYTQIPNLIFELMTDMKDSEFKVIMVVCRATFGFHRQRKQLSILDLVDQTGLGKTAVLAGIQAGLERGILTRQETVLHGRNTWTYSIDVAIQVTSETSPKNGQDRSEKRTSISPKNGQDQSEINTSYRYKENINIKEREKESSTPPENPLESPVAFAVRKVCQKDKMPLSAKQSEALFEFMLNTAHLNLTVAMIEEFGRKVKGHWIGEKGPPSIGQVYDHWPEVMALQDPGGENGNGSIRNSDGTINAAAARRRGAELSGMQSLPRR